MRQIIYALLIGALIMSKSCNYIKIEYWHIVVLAIILIVSTTEFVNREQLTSLSNEAIQNIAKVYNEDTLVVKNLIVTGNSKLGNWNIRNDRIGVEGRTDLQMANDYLYFKKYDKNDYNGGIVCSNVLTQSIGDNGFNSGKLQLNYNDISAPSAKITLNRLDTGGVKISGTGLMFQKAVNFPTTGVLPVIFGGVQANVSSYVCIVSGNNSSFGDNGKGGSAYVYPDAAGNWFVAAGARGGAVNGVYIIGIPRSFFPDWVPISA
jgi:hypothetical protein